MAEKSSILDLSDDISRQNPLVITKLYVPRVRSKLVPRPRLTELLNGGMGRKLTLVSAPAGFGKTTLLSEWRQQSKLPAAWFSLDEDDNDPARFWAYFLSALQTIRVDIGENILPLFHSPPPLPTDSILTALINDIATVPDEFTLVLDDYHVIDNQKIHKAMTFLLDHLPLQMHLVIASRANPPLPLARLRAQDQLTEIHAGDLRFTSDESATFLKEVMGLGLSAEEVVALETRTEGWIAGLQLAALSMQGREDVHEFIETFTGDYHYILDYLSEEVLRRQPKSVQAFLLQTCILDRLTGPLCDAITGQENGQEMLERLEEANLFIMPLDDKRYWYRYHGLFANLLRRRLSQLQPARVPELHLRASKWCEHNGLVSEAVDHALAAGDLERAARLVEDSARGFLFRGEMTKLMGWLNALSDELVRSRPRLCIDHAWLLITTGYQFEAAEAWLREAERTLDTHPSETKDASTAKSVQGPVSSESEVEHMRGRIAALRAHIALLRGDRPRTVTLARQALERLPEDDLTLRAFVSLTLGRVYRDDGDASALRLILAQVNTISKATDTLGLSIMALDNLATMQVMQGQLHQAAKTWRQVLKLVRQRSARQLPMASAGYIGLGSLWYEWNDLDAATRYATEGIELAKQGGLVGTLLNGYILLAQLKQAQRNLDDALDILQEAAQLVPGYSENWLVAKVAAYQAQLWVAQGNLQATARWEQERGWSAEDKPSYLREFEHLTLARVLIAQGRHEEAVSLLKRLFQAANTAGRVGSVIQILALQALALHVRGKSSGAMVALEQTLSLAETEGYIRTFVDEGAPMADLLCQAASRKLMPDYVLRLLAAFGPTTAPRPPASEQLIEFLTERELEILRLLAARLSSREIAEELTISMHTARTHIKNIYSKLNAHNRVQAIERARALNLLYS